MIVLKFGGTSVGGAEQMRRVGGIIESCLERRPVVVSSAVGGITNRLFKVVDLALEQAEWQAEFDALAAAHEKIIEELGLEQGLVTELLNELHELVQGIRLIRECTPRTKDYFVSFGERLAVRILAAHLESRGIPAQALDAFDIGLITDGRFGAARPLPDADDNIREALAKVQGVPVITGYIGKDENGNITTLGRGGSDYSAAIFGAALDAEEIQIWTDVDGVMTVDPRIVKEARFLEELSFAEAAELAFYGAKVIHPATIIPAVRKNIPLRILNSYRPDFQGTVIVPEPKTSAGRRKVKSIASKDEVCIVSIVAPPMLLQYGFMDRIADIFAQHEVVIDMIATSEVSVSMTTDSRALLDPVVSDLRKIGEVSVQRDMSQISIVGEQISADVDFAAKIFQIVADLGVRIDMISFGATRNNLSFVIAKDRVRDAVIALHRGLFEAS